METDLIESVEIVRTYLYKYWKFNLSKVKESKEKDIKKRELETLNLLLTEFLLEITIEGIKIEE